MTCKFVFLPIFDRAVKQLKKQYRHINADLETAVASIEQNPDIGSVIPRDYAVRKLRVASSDLQRGKSGGFRLLYKLANEPEQEIIVYLLFVYAKVDRADISLKELEKLIETIDQE